jgi:hypothetical protein
MELLMKGTTWIGWWLTMVILLISTIGISTTSRAANWWENVKFKGDLRYRHEIIK